MSGMRELPVVGEWCGGYLLLGEWYGSYLLLVSGMGVTCCW